MLYCDFSEATEADLEKAWLSYNVVSGKHVRRNLTAKSEDDSTTSEISQLQQLVVGDTLTVRVLGARLVDTGAEEVCLQNLGHLS